MNIGSTHAITGKFETEALSVVCLQTAPISAQNMDDVQKKIWIPSSISWIKPWGLSRRRSDRHY